MCLLPVGFESTGPKVLWIFAGNSKTHLRNLFEIDDSNLLNRKKKSEIKKRTFDLYLE